MSRQDNYEDYEYIEDGAADAGGQDGNGDGNGWALDEQEQEHADDHLAFAGIGAFAGQNQPQSSSQYQNNQQPQQIGRPASAASSAASAPPAIGRATAAAGPRRGAGSRNSAASTPAPDAASMTAQRKLHHSQMEKEYRKVLNRCLDKLRITVPSCSREDPKNLNKAEVLLRTVAYIEHIQRGGAVFGAAAEAAVGESPAEALSAENNAGPVTAGTTRRKGSAGSGARRGHRKTNSSASSAPSTTTRAKRKAPSYDEQEEEEYEDYYDNEHLDALDEEEFGTVAGSVGSFQTPSIVVSPTKGANKVLRPGQSPLQRFASPVPMQTLQISTSTPDLTAMAAAVAGAPAGLALGLQGTDEAAAQDALAQAAAAFHPAPLITSLSMPQLSIPAVSTIPLTNPNMQMQQMQVYDFDPTTGQVVVIAAYSPSTPRTAVLPNIYAPGQGMDGLVDPSELNTLLSPDARTFRPSFSEADLNRPLLAGPPRKVPRTQGPSASTQQAVGIPPHVIRSASVPDSLGRRSSPGMGFGFGMLSKGEDQGHVQQEELQALEEEHENDFFHIGNESEHGNDYYPEQ